MHIVIEGFLVALKVIYFYFEAAYQIIFPPKRKDINGEIVLITGAGHGIGREFALEFSRLGARVVLWDINKDNNDSVADEIRALGREAHAYTCDVTNFDDVHRVGQQVREDVGEVGILVNNAGILYGGALLDMKPKHIQRTFEVNTLAQFWTVKEFLPYMMERNKGHIVNVASMSAKSGTAYLVDYSSSKYAVYGYTESLKEEIDRLGKNGVITSCVCPMFVSSGLVQRPKDRFATKILTPKETAVSAVDGILRNRDIVYVPQNIWFKMIIQSLLTTKARDLLKKFGDFGITPQYDPNTTVGARLTKTK
ncbi:hypothetical protein LOTGIDRAFT_200993 [Lottia gigantea]|uniref:Short-chain dehydrogenase/reductase 3 n=1 Tax=Lottia gigantea TaxID=225164 RepID=V4AYL3_LOTGI|nr:hypothetical protein LOTGIDRAFT_200993 [Lottia gigantea]ESP00211.1 hypothetical protein LOTGIDRAFT_200993 [Lottia gigantea]